VEVNHLYRSLPKYVDQWEVTKKVKRTVSGPSRKPARGNARSVRKKPERTPNGVTIKLPWAEVRTGAKGDHVLTKLEEFVIRSGLLILQRGKEDRPVKGRERLVNRRFDRPVVKWRGGRRENLQYRSYEKKERGETEGPGKGESSKNADQKKTVRRVRAFLERGSATIIQGRETASLKFREGRSVEKKGIKLGRSQSHSTGA